MKIHTLCNYHHVLFIQTDCQGVYIFLLCKIALWEWLGIATSANEINAYNHVISCLVINSLLVGKRTQSDLFRFTAKSEVRPKL